MRITRKRGLADGLDAPVGDTERVTARALLLPVVLGLLLVGVVATSVVLLRDRHDPPTAPAALRPADVGAAGSRGTPAGRAVLRAEAAAATYFTVDYRTIDADMDKMRALGTPDFVAGYDRNATRLARRVTRQKIVLSADVRRDAAATEFLTADLAQVLVAVDVTTRRPDGERSTPYRTRVTLERSGGGWLVGAIDEVG